MVQVFTCVSIYGGCLVGKAIVFWGKKLGLGAGGSVVFKGWLSVLCDCGFEGWLSLLFGRCFEDWLIVLCCHG